MIIQPYMSFDVLRLGESTKFDCVARFGDPSRICTNPEGAEELHYPDFILRIDPKQRTLRECTLLPYATATIAGIDVTWDKEFLARACALDGSPRDVFGFIVLREFGVAVTGIHDNDASQLAITVFSEGDFDKLLEDSKPFDYGTS
jgi:hypothetical protein